MDVQHIEVIMQDIEADCPITSVYVVMGSSGVGKSTIAKAVAQKYNCIFMEGDDFHSEENVKLMSSGQALNDSNRAPWLKALSCAAAANRQANSVFITCSALKRRYRDEIRSHIPDAKFVHLHGEFDYVGALLQSREGHFMPLSLLRSQFDTLEVLEADELGITIPIEKGVDDVLAKLESFMHNNAWFKEKVKASSGV